MCYQVRPDSSHRWLSSISVCSVNLVLPSSSTQNWDHRFWSHHMERCKHKWLTSNSKIPNHSPSGSPPTWRILFTPALANRFKYHFQVIFLHPWVLESFQIKSQRASCYQTFSWVVSEQQLLTCPAEWCQFWSSQQQILQQSALKTTLGNLSRCCWTLTLLSITRALRAKLRGPVWA